VDRCRKDWSIKFDDALWAHRITYKTHMGTTLYLLVCGKYCHLLVEVEHKAIKALNFSLKSAEERCCLELYELNELRLEAHKSSHIHKERTKH